MARPAHTPGPWLYRPQEFDDWGVVRTAPDAEGRMWHICQARDPRAFTEKDFATYRATKTDPWEANARLIAAAPELLEALRACRDQFDFYAREHRKAEKHDKAGTNERFAFLASQAIAKAEG